MAENVIGTSNRKVDDFLDNLIYYLSVTCNLLLPELLSDDSYSKVKFQVVYKPVICHG